MLALIEVVPYLAFAGAALLVAFVAGEALYKRFLSVRFSAIGARSALAQAPAKAAHVTRQITSSVGVAATGMQQNVRIADVRVTAGHSENSDRIASGIQDSKANPAASDSLQPVEDRIVTVEMPTLGRPDIDRQVPSSPENAKTSESGVMPLEEGNLCNDVVAIRRDPSVRVFDAVVAPSERKTSAA